MGVMVFKGTKRNILSQLARVMKRFGEGFLQFADTGFRYIYVRDDENKR